MAKAAGKKRVTIIPAIHGKLTYDRKVCEPDIARIIEKWLDRHPEIRKRRHEIRALSGLWATEDGLRTEVVMSLVAFVAHGFDKRRACIDGRRLPEKTLHLMALPGGWPGALIGQRILRHKTQKLSFRIVFWLYVALHLLLVGGVIYLWSGRK